MRELDAVISAAEEMEAKLNLAAKQDQPSLAAVTSSYGAARQPRGNTAAKGRFPYAKGAAMLAEATMVEVTLTVTLTRALLLPLLHKVLILNPLVTALSTMWVGLQVLVPNRTTLQISVAFAKALGTPYTIAGSWRGLRHKLPKG